MFPQVLNARQRFPPSVPVDVGAALGAHWPFAIVPGARIAVAVGSRGIARIADVARAVIDRVRAAGGHPYIVPAMGSHGGGTAEGQASLLAEYGITEAALGVPVHASMDVEQVATIEDGVPVHLAREAARADGIIAIGRIKPHTSFRGPVESGIAKMIAVGLGKRDGAAAFHAAAERFGFPRVIEGMLRAKLGAARFLGGVALLEDQHHALAKVAILRADEILEREPALLAEAWAMMPRLPVREIDLLIVDAIGKNISGSGMDPNVTGRGFAGPSVPGAPPVPTVRLLFARALTPETHGNAIGIGMADFTTTRLVRAFDRPATYMNALASLSLRAAKIPIHFDTDRDVIAQALATLSLRDPRQARVVRIANTLALETLQLSPACLADGPPPGQLEIAGPPFELAFDADGNLTPLRTG